MFKRAAAVIPGGLVFAALLLSQQSAGPAFEVASVKASAAGATAHKGGGRSADPGLFSLHNRPLKSIILIAYGLPDYQLAGGPLWIADERFDIDARPPGAATEEQKLAMLRTLLAERFRLRTHHESRPLEVYAMTVAKGGPRFGPQFHKVDEEKLIAETNAFNQQAGVNMGGSMAEFANLLRRNMRTNHPPDWPFGNDDPPAIIDQTGLTGLYFIYLVHPGYQGDFAAAAESQLGLKLTLRKTPLDVLVIDSVSRPSEN